jgi:hypothetical protein
MAGLSGRYTTDRSFRVISDFFENKKGKNKKQWEFVRNSG